jgi:nucleoporin NUP2
LKPTQTKAALSFVGHDNGVSQTYSVRVATENEAKQLKEMFDREIAFVKAKEEL